MPELGPYGSVRGARGNSRPYRDSHGQTVKTALLTQSRLWILQAIIPKSVIRDQLLSIPAG